MCHLALSPLTRNVSVGTGPTDTFCQQIDAYPQIPSISALGVDEIGGYALRNNLLLAFFSEKPQFTLIIPNRDKRISANFDHAAGAGVEIYGFAPIGFAADSMQNARLQPDRCDAVLQPLF